MYLFVIYSCKKNYEKSHMIYDLIIHRLKTCKCYILYGDENLECSHKILDDKYIILKCGDNYENLCEKSMTLFKTVKTEFPNVKGLFKCDDDIFPNIRKINEIISFINNNEINYLGISMPVTYDHYSNGHYNKCSTTAYNIPKLAQTCVFATGPFYYLSNRSIDILVNTVVDYDIIMYEDNMVGYILNQNNIFVHHYQPYYDSMEYDKGSLQNHNNKKFLYVLLHGGLGNQLFQVSAAYEIARKNNMLLILLYKKEYHKIMTHNKSADEYMKTIFSYFNYTYYENVDTSKLKIYNEEKCFDYNPNIITESANYLIHGYFQNKNYIPDNSDILSIFNNDDICNRLLGEYPLLTDSFFIHFRIGDYEHYGSLYHLDKNGYYKNAIDYILERFDNPHFFILSDDIDFVKTFSVLNDIRKTIITDMDTLDSLYFMSLCKNGGICANSTFSGWGSKLNNNKNKTVICPKQWININYPYEIPFDYTIAL